MVPPEPQYEPRRSDAGTLRQEIVVMLVPRLTDEFVVPDDVEGEKTLTWQEIERTRPKTPLTWWRDALERRGTIPNSLEWLKEKGFILSGEASGWRLAFVHQGRVIARMHPDSPIATTDVHFDRWSED